MNDRLKELLEQATEVYDQWHRGESVCMVDYKMFAELIVRECVGLVNEQLQHNNPNDSLLALKIKEHFGVKE